MNRYMAEKSIGKVTQIIGAVLDIKFPDAKLPEINDAVNITRKDGSKLVVEVAQHLGMIQSDVLPWERPTGLCVAWKP